MKRLWPLALLVVAAIASPVEGAPAARGGSPGSDERALLADLGDGVPGLFVRLVNRFIKGRIDPRAIDFKAPAGVDIVDVVLSDADGHPVARAKRASASLSLKSLLSGNIVISELTLVEPRIIAAVEDGKLNLLDALSPRKQKEGGQPPDAELRIDRITVIDGGFRFTDPNATISLDGITGEGTFSLDLRQGVPVIRAAPISVKTGSVKLPDLDVPLTGALVKRLVIVGDKLEIEGATGKVLGADVLVRGALQMRPPGKLDFSGYAKAPRGTWPGRLQRPPFEPPSFEANFTVTGPYADPVVSADGSFGPVDDVYGYSTSGGRASVVVGKDQVRIASSQASLSPSGTVEVTGTVSLPGLMLDLVASGARVPLRTALAPSGAGGDPQGTLGGRVRIQGPANGPRPLSITGTAQGSGLVLYGVRAPAGAKAEIDVAVLKGDVDLRDVRVAGDGVQASVKGPIDLDAKRLDLSVQLDAARPERFVVDLPKEIVAQRARWQGRVSGPFASARATGPVVVEGADAWGVPAAELKANLDASAERVLLTDVVGAVAKGKATGRFEVVLGGASDRLVGSAEVKGADLASLAVPALKDTPLTGRADVRVKLSGPLRDPSAEVTATGERVTIAEESIGAVRAVFVADKRRLTTSSLVVDGPIGTVVADRFVVGFADETLAGSARVRRLALSAIGAAKESKLGGTAEGTLVVGGTFAAPRVDADLAARGVHAGEVRFGDGRAKLALSHEAPTKKKGAGRMLVSVSASLADVRGAYELRGALYPKDQVVNATLRFHDVDVGPLTAELDEYVAPMEGIASGLLAASGPLDALTMDLRVRAPSLSLRLPDAQPESGDAPAAGGSTPGGRLRTLGAVALDARMVKGKLEGKLCAFPGSGRDAPGSPCSAGERVWASIAGTVDLQKGGFDLSVAGLVDERRVEDIVVALKTEDVGVGGRLRFQARVARKDQNARVRATAAGTLESMRAVLPGAPEIELVEPVDLQYAEQRLQIARPARFTTASKDVNVTVAGSVGSDDIDLALDGTVALALAKLATEEIASASGTAKSKLRLTGRYEDGLRIVGELEPQKGAAVLPRALGQRVQLEGGLVRFFPTPEDPNLQRVEVDEDRPLAVRIGDGAAALRGAVDVRTATNRGEKAWVARWDLNASGTGLDMKTANGPVELAFDVALRGSERDPVLVGRVEVTDGNLRERFELRNFVLEQGPTRPTEPLHARLEPFGLADLTFDVEAALQNLRTRAELSSFTIDASLRGDLRLGGSLRVPQLTGAVEVEEGTIVFPRARFEIEEMQAEFPTNAEGRINPKIRLVAHSEVAPEVAGTEAELPVDLTLEGNLDRMRLDLTALGTTRDGREFSRVDLLSLVLFGRPVVGVAGSGGGAALRAFSTELSGALTRELEEAIERQFGATLQFDVLADEASANGGVQVSAGVRWQIGRRLELEGEAPLLPAFGGGLEPQPGDLDATAQITEQLRLRLLIFDHLPVGQDLAFEGRVANTRLTGRALTELRLGYRIFER